MIKRYLDLLVQSAYISVKVQRTMTNCNRFKHCRWPEVCCFLLILQFLPPRYMIATSQWVNDCCLTSTQQFFSYIMARTSSFSMKLRWDPLCSRPTRLVLFFIVAAISLKQQSAGRHVAPLGHINLIPSQPVFALNVESLAEK